MNPIRCFIVDDEPPAVTLLEKYCGMVDQLQLVGTSHGALKAFGQLEQTGTELLFLDIRMPVLNGIDFLKTLQNPPAVVLTTAHREYALEGYDLDILDYLLKPIAFDRFLRAIDRFQSQRVATTPITPLPAPEKEHVFFTVNRRQHKIVIADILHLESLKDYVRIHTDAERLVVKGNLSTILKALPEDLFVRVHRSFAVALNRVDAFNRSVVCVNGTELPVGGSYRREFVTRMNTDRSPPG